MFASASGSVAPCDQQPGKPGHDTANPSSDGYKTTRYFMLPPTLVHLDPIRDQRGQLLLTSTETMIRVLHDRELKVGAGAERIGESGHAARDVAIAVLVPIAVEHE